MRKMILFAAVAFSGFAALPIAAVADDISTCRLYSDLATTIMGARQHGIPMADVMEVEADPSIADLRRSLIIWAYEEPRYYTEDLQRDSAVDFANEVYLACMKAGQP